MSEGQDCTIQSWIRISFTNSSIGLRQVHFLKETKLPYQTSLLFKKNEKTNKQKTEMISKGS